MKQITVQSTAIVPASFALKLERFLNKHKPPDFEFELHCTVEEQPAPKRRRNHLHPTGLLKVVLAWYD